MTHHLATPLGESTLRSLHVGDLITLTGDLFTARDAAHRRIIDLQQHGQPLPFDVAGTALYHCGPIMRWAQGQWTPISAGPTTSSRMEGSEPEVIRRLQVRLIIGKGGMGPDTLSALADVGGIYAHYTGGAGALAARSIRRVSGVHWLEELGMPEAVWRLAVDAFGPLTVTMDSHGRNLYEEISRDVNRYLEPRRQDRGG